MVKSTLLALLSAKKNGFKPNIGSIGVGGTFYHKLFAVFKLVY
jgi:hypothetical protein